MVAGVLKRAINPLKKASASVPAFISTKGMASGQHVKRSMQVSKYLYPSEYGKGPPMSTWTWSNISSGSLNLPKADLLYLVFAFWQPLQLRHQFAIAMFMPCQTNLPLISGLVAQCDGCPNPCKLVNTFFRNFSVMCALPCPVDTSHQIELSSKDLSNWKFNVEDVEWRNRINSVSKAWS